MKERDTQCIKYTLCCLFFILSSSLSMGKERQQEMEDDVRKQQILYVMSYNVENLFDTINDPKTDDEAFTPEGRYHWTEERLAQKISNVAQVISDIGKWDYPALVGLIEVENKDVVQRLVAHPYLYAQKYLPVVTKGDDPRGIDVALLIHPKYFQCVRSFEIPNYDCDLLYYPLRQIPRDKEKYKERNTLWAVLKDRVNHQLYDVLVTHFPSRRGGVQSTAVKREKVAKKIHTVISAIHRLRGGKARIILMGDFNAHPTSSAVEGPLNWRTPPHVESELLENMLYDLALPLENREEGSHYFDKRFWTPDQIIVSTELLRSNNAAVVSPARQIIFHPDYLRGKNNAPRRTFKGFRYDKNGYSDHFPVFIQLHITQKAR